MPGSRTNGNLDQDAPNGGPKYLLADILDRTVWRFSESAVLHPLNGDGSCSDDFVPPGEELLLNRDRIPRRRTNTIHSTGDEVITIRGCTWYHYIELV